MKWKESFNTGLEPLVNKIQEVSFVSQFSKSHYGSNMPKPPSLLDLRKGFEFPHTF